MKTLTKTEVSILDQVRQTNTYGALCGLGTNPKDSDFGSKEHRFVKRLFDAGLIVHVPYTGKYGSGWALPDYVKQFEV